MQIDKNIPIPRRNRHLAKYPWKEMEIGDSFVCKHRPPMYAAFKSGIKIATRKEGDHYRVWRIA